MSRAVFVPLAWLLLVAFALLARLGRWSVARSVLLAAVRRASGAAAPRRERSAGGAIPPGLVGSFEAAHRLRPFPIPCLPRALALHRLLVLSRVPARVRLGLASEPRHPSHGRPPLAGHAWVECGGVPVGEGGATVARFRPCETS